MGLAKHPRVLLVDFIPTGLSLDNSNHAVKAGGEILRPVSDTQNGSYE